LGRILTWKRIVGLDPGTHTSSVVEIVRREGVVDGNPWIPDESRTFHNARMGEWLAQRSFTDQSVLLAMEHMAPRPRKPSGWDTFKTIWWTGWFAAKWYNQYTTLARQHVCGQLTHDTRATKGKVNNAIIARYGKPGTTADPGWLFGIHDHEWDALAIALVIADYIEGGCTWVDTSRERGIERDETKRRRSTKARG